jgi:small subunit ribosomal protein S6
MITYEALVVLETNRPDAQITESIEKIEALIARNGGTVKSRDAWGKRKLAYQINRRREGYYVLVLFDAPPTGPALAELNRHLRISEDVLRFMVTRAVVGKSRGVPPPEGFYEEQRSGRFGRADGPRDRGDRGDRGGRFERRPSAGEAPREAEHAAPAEASPEA